MDNLIDLFLYGCLIPAAVGALISHVLRKKLSRFAPVSADRSNASALGYESSPSTPLDANLFYS